RARPTLARIRASTTSSQIVVVGELRWMRHKVDHPGLFPLPLNPRLDQRLGKDAALEQKLVVGFQSIERLVQAARKRPDLAPLLNREAVQVAIVRPVPERHRIELTFDAVESSH